MSGGTSIKRTSTAWKLIAFATIWALVFFFWLMPKGTINVERRKVLIPSEQRGPDRAIPLPPVRLVQSNVGDKDQGVKIIEPKNKKDPFAIVNGVDYFADYDVSKVSQEPEVFVPTPVKPLKFMYMDRNTSKWPFLWVSGRPRIAYVPDFLTDEECDTLIGTATPNMVRSQVIPFKDSGKKDFVDPARTSSQTWLSVNDGIGGQVASKIYDLIHFPPGSSEMLQILRYEVGQKYNAHMDYLDPALYGPQKDNRAVTVYLYLSDVEEGGHTWFPDADNHPQSGDLTGCQRGFGFKPHKRTAVVFYDMKPNGDYDPWSLHGSCPVKKGTKWGGTLWFRIPV